MEEGISLREKWQGIKRHKEQVTPTFDKAKDIRGNRVATWNRAEATAEYLEKRQWQRGEDIPERNTNPIKVVNRET